MFIMKELKKIKIANYTPLSDEQMKEIKGMAMRSNCSAICDGGDDLEITDCNGNCIAIDNVGVGCYGPTAILFKPCHGTGY
jgi:hypothetical protein